MIGAIALAATVAAAAAATNSKNVNNALVNTVEKNLPGMNSPVSHRDGRNRALAAPVAGLAL